MRQRRRRRRARAILPVSVVVISFAACANEPSAPGPLDGPWEPAPDVPTRAVLTCGTDGSTTLSDQTLQPQPDGVHLRVINEYDEPVSVEGFDADSGVTNWVFSRPPGTMELMCWPFSQHSSEGEPERVALQIVDPKGLYVDGSLPCEGDIEMHTIVEWVDRPVHDGPPPLDVARQVIDGLRPDDVLRVDGYPEQDGSAVVVIRDERIVGRYGISRFEGKPWTITSGSACEGTGLPHEGQSYG